MRSVSLESAQQQTRTAVDKMNSLKIQKSCDLDNGAFGNLQYVFINDHSHHNLTYTDTSKVGFAVQVNNLIMVYDSMKTAC